MSYQKRMLQSQRLLNKHKVKQIKFETEIKSKTFQKGKVKLFDQKAKTLSNKDFL